MSGSPDPDLKRWVDNWRVTGPLLERIRMEELRDADTQEAVAIFTGMLPSVLSRFPPRPTSGLVDLQRIFQKLRR